MDRRTLRRRLARRPHAVRFEELVRLLTLSGWEQRRVEGSHHTFARGEERIAVPYRRPHLLAVYVREVLRRTKEAGDDV